VGSRIAGQITEAAVTCEAVLAETAFHVGGCSFVLALVASGLVRLAFDASQHLDRLAELAARYADRKPDLADPLPDPNERTSPGPSDHHN
jgi:hypothetical protein